jgi:lipopolysaccharide core galacturonosyltransferase RgtB
MTGSALESEKQLTIRFFLALGSYFILHILLRVLLSDSLDYDEAEQALLGQWLLPGYTEQPPLYTWLQHFLFVLFGKNVFAVSLLKNGLLFLTYSCVYFAACEILKDRRSAVLATFSILLIPQIGWESQRDMTHTTLVVFAASATLWQTMRLVHNRSVVNYCILGLLLGTGIMAKANFALFITVLFLTLCSFAEGRKILFTRKIILSLLVIAAFTATYFFWMAGNQDIVFSATHKFKRGIEHSLLLGTISLITNSFLFLTPLWLICCIVFPSGFRRNDNPDPGFPRRFIGRYLLFLFLTLLVVVLLFKVTYVKDRWLQPLLFAAPIYFFSRLSPARITSGKSKIYLGIVLVAALAVYCTFTIRVLGASAIGNFCRLNYPFNAMAEDLRESGFTEGLIISDNRFLAGNFHFRFPSGTAIVPDYRFETLVEPGRYSSVAVVWKADESLTIPANLDSFLRETYAISAADYPVDYFKHPYLFAHGETVTLAAMFIPLPPLENRSSAR